MLPLRGLTAFPNMIVHFDVGRMMSIRALEAAMKNGQTIFLTAQRELKTDTPTPSDLYQIGTICQIRQILRLPGDNIRVLVEGKTRALAHNFIAAEKDEDCMYAEVEELEDYVYGVTKMDFLSSMGYSLLITITSVVLILLCCSMTGWYLTRVNNKLSKFMNLLIVFSMVVPFQMVMFTLSKTADRLNLNNPWNICIIYLGFGAGLAVFMFTGFMKSVPMEIEEAAMIDGCNPIQIFFKVVFPILKPTMISTAILETMWVWNDYLLPTLVLDIKKYRTIPMAIQYFRGGYGRVELAPMMACIIIAIIPIIILYMTCQKYIIEGVVAGAVKG